MSQRHGLRSDALNLLHVPQTRLVAGSRDFASVGPTIWNGLPHSLRQHGLPIAEFRRKLKSYLFVKAYPFF